MDIHISWYGYRIGITTFIYSACLSRVPTYVRGYRTLYLRSQEQPNGDGSVSAVMGEEVENFLG